MFEYTEKDIAALIKRLRTKRKWSREMVARKLKISAVVVYNIETARSRPKISYFIELLRINRFDPSSILETHIYSVQSVSEAIESKDWGKLVKTFRTRLNLSQKNLADAMNYKSASIIHHFEKNLREPQVGDLFKLMTLTGDNLRGFIQHITEDSVLAQKFPKGFEVQFHEWEEYWSKHYISAVRQIMRTDTYEQLPRYKPGFFKRTIGISIEEENHALRVLLRLGIVKVKKNKPVLDSAAQIVIPKKLNPKIIQNLKSDWLDFGRQRFQSGSSENHLHSVDIIPANAEILTKIREGIRELQDKIHSMPLENTDGFIHLSWLCNYLPTPKPTHSES